MNATIGPAGYVSEFVLEHGRYPRIGDDIPPWRWRGWALPYVQALHAHPAVPFPDRWGYLTAAKLTGELPGPIPQVHFHRHPGRELFPGEGKPPLKQLADLSELASEGGRRHRWDGFARLVDWLRFALGLSPDYSPIGEDYQERLYRTLNLGAWLTAPWDYFGEFVCENLGTGWNPHAFYPTPHDLCAMMATMTYGDGADPLSSVSDPCCGTGRFLLYASNYSLRLYGQDIDRLMVGITEIHGALYMPWLVSPLPAGVRPAAEIPPPPSPGSARRVKRSTSRA